MRIYGELASFNTKTLKSLDIGVEIKIYAICNEDYEINMDELKNLLKQPLQIDLNINEVELT